MSSNWDACEEIKIFQEYLQIPSIVGDNCDYAPCIKFLKNEASKLLLPVKVLYPAGPKHPIVLIQWKGVEPDLPTIALTSHMDVASADGKDWSYPPFAAQIDFQGRITARGAQDMKCSGMHYLAAIRALKREKIKLKRTLWVMFVPDAEINLKYGMASFVPTNDFKCLNIGFAIGEGLASSCEAFEVFYGERIFWRLRFKIKGPSGPSALLIKNTVGEKVRKLIDQIMDYRTTENKRLNYRYTKLNLGDVNSINLTMANGSIQDGVIPPEITICVDVRLSTKIDYTEFEERINQWMEEAGGDIELIYDQKDPYIKPTVLENNPFWDAFQNATSELDMNTNVTICPGATDSRFMREVGIPVIGFSAVNKTQNLANNHNEYLCIGTYLRGIEIWKKIILHVGNA